MHPMYAVSCGQQLLAPAAPLALEVGQVAFCCCCGCAIRHDCQWLPSDGTVCLKSALFTLPFTGCTAIHAHTVPPWGRMTYIVHWFLKGMFHSRHGRHLLYQKTRHSGVFLHPKTGCAFRQCMPLQLCIIMRDGTNNSHRVCNSGSCQVFVPFIVADASV